MKHVYIQVSVEETVTNSEEFWISTLLGMRIVSFDPKSDILVGKIYSSIRIFEKS